MKNTLFAILLLFSGLLIAQKEDKKEEVKPIPKAQTFVTKHQGVFGGKTIDYTATGKETILTNKDVDSMLRSGPLPIPKRLWAMLENVLLPLFLMAARVRHPCGCTWAFLVLKS
jgi:hypothetical protein